MKRLLLGLILLLAATAGFAQNRDVLLTPDGMLYTVDVMQSDDAVMSSASSSAPARHSSSAAKVRSYKSGSMRMAAIAAMQARDSVDSPLECDCFHTVGVY